MKKISTIGVLVYTAITSIFGFGMFRLGYLMKKKEAEKDKEKTIEELNNDKREWYERGYEIGVKVGENLKEMRN